jgi:hypothetical protein
MPNLLQEEECIKKRLSKELSWIPSSAASALSDWTTGLEPRSKESAAALSAFCKEQSLAHQKVLKSC